MRVAWASRAKHVFIRARNPDLPNEVFAPRVEEIAYAERVLAAARDAAGRGTAVFTLDGQMIDEPIIEQARAIVALAAKLGAPQS